MKSKIIKNIKTCIKEQHGGRINYRKVASAIGMPSTTLFQIFKERRKPRLDTLEKLMNYAGCEVTCKKQKKGDCMKCIGSHSKKAA